MSFLLPVPISWLGFYFGKKEIVRGNGLGAVPVNEAPLIGYCTMT